MIQQLLTVIVLLVGLVSAQYIGPGPARPDAGVRLYLNGELANFTIIRSGDVSDTSISNVLWCQSANNRTTIGEWFVPSGTNVSTVDADGPLHVLYDEAQIGLLRDMGIGDEQGLYRCVIPDENEVNQDLWIAIYRGSTYDTFVTDGETPTIDRSILFSLVSTSRDTDSPVFTLSFNVTTLPPSTVTCTAFVNGTMIDIPDEDIDRYVTEAQYPDTNVLVTVTIRSRQSGTYQCTIGGIPGNTEITSVPLIITATNSPTSVASVRSSFNQAILSWSPPAINDPIVDGYEVFYDSPDGTRLSVDVGNTTMMILDSLDPELFYTAFVIAYGGDLPSTASSLVNITEAFSVDAPVQSTYLAGDSDISIRCTFDVNVQLNSLQLVWLYYNIINMTELTFGSGENDVLSMEQRITQSLDLTFDVVTVSNAGEYTCGANLSDSMGKSIQVMSNLTLFVEIPSPTVNDIYQGSGTGFNRTFITGDGIIYCNAEVPSIGVPVSVSFNWWGPEGQITEDDKYQFMATEDNNSRIVTGQLVIRNLNSQDNLTMYYCSVVVDVIGPTNYSDFVIPGTATSENITLVFEELPVAVVTINPSGAPIIGQDFSLDCSAMFDDSIATVTYQWLINGSTLFREGITLSNNDATLIVNSVNITDEGSYTCIATLDIADLEVPNDTVSSATYDFSTLDDPVVQISSTGSNIAGSVYTLTCTVSVVTGTPNITWINLNGDEVDDSLLTLLNDDSELILQFQSLDYSDIGVYTCSANLSIPALDFLGMGSDTVIVDIQIPTPSVTVTADTIDAFIRGTERYITCTVTLNTPLPMDTSVAIEWMRDGVTFDNSTNRVIANIVESGNTYSSTITFSLLNTTDSGTYECTGTVDTDIMNDNIISSTNNEQLSATVEDIPDAVVTLSANGSGFLTDDYSLTCSVLFTEGLIGFTSNLTLEKMTDNGYEVLNYSTTISSITVDLSPLTTTDTGTYKCSFNTIQDAISYERTFEDLTNITAIIPPVVVQVSTDPANLGTLIEGTYIDLVCNSSVNDDGVDTVYTVTVQWSRNGTTIMDGTDYSISPVTTVSGNYISTIRIEELSTSDDYSLFTCSVIVTPSVSTFITGSDGNDDIIIRVREFVTSDITVAVSFSSISITAGDQLNVTCTATVPQRLLYTPSAVVSYDTGGQQVVAEDNTDATQSEVSQDGNVFSRVVTIDPVKTTDARRYYCSVSFGQPLDTSPALMSNDLSVNIPPPTMSVSLSPSGIIYESTLLVITCNATLPSTVDTVVTATVTWTGPNSLVNTSGRIIVDPAISVDDNVFQSQLTFQPVDNGNTEKKVNDAGQYTCEMVISSTDSLILTGTNDITEDIVVTDLPDLMVNISTSGSTEVGQSLNITCTVVLVEGLVGNISIKWDKMDGISDLEDLNITVVRVSDGPVTLMLDPVQFNYRGLYMCEAMYNVSLTNDGDSLTEVTQLTVDFPPFDVTISQDYSDPLYTGTNLTITCDIELSSLVDIPVNVSNNWTRDGADIMESTITNDLVEVTSLKHTATLEFYPLYHATDDGLYQCSVMISSDDDEYVNSISNSASTTLDVLDLPNPVVNVSRTSSSPSVGDPFEFVCSVSVVDRLIVSPVISWTKYVSSADYSLPADDISVDAVKINNELSLDFIRLNTSDAGRYTCEAVLTIPQIPDVTRSTTHQEDLTLQIPTPEVTVTRSQVEDTLLAGSQLTIYCDIVVDINVNTPFTVDTTWTRTNNDDNDTIINSTTGRVVVYSPYSTGINKYQSRIEFSTLSSVEDPGDYTCEVLIDSNANYTFVYNSDDDADTTTLQIINPSIGNFSAFPDQFLGLETSCEDSDTFDTFTLNCTATKPLIVLPNLELYWLHNGTIRSSNSITYNMTNGDVLYKLNVLSFPTSTAEDTGSYECVARIVIPDSDNITETEESLVLIRAARLPYTATNVFTSVSTTTVNITFTIPAIAYTPERYYIVYNGLELQTDITNSPVIIGEDSITVTDQVYTITLYGLEEANTYNFSVVSVNCEGETRTLIESFTTNPDVPTGVVLDCRNTTFNSRDVTLSWSPPTRDLQNGIITGYDLFCYEIQSNTLVPDTNDTLDSPDTTYTVPVITPFRSYNCGIAAINSEGVGPFSNCLFYSAQDVPSDSPQTFESVAEQSLVNFTWTPPTTPNGIITGYNLIVSKLSTTTTNNYNTTSYTYGANIRSVSLYGFSPFQKYNATITASTVVGYGPVATTEGRTEPDVSSLVRLSTISATGFPGVLTLPTVNPTTLNITWRRPLTPNGNITRYNIEVNNRNEEQNRIINVDAIDGQEIYTQLVTGLNAGTPYYVTVGVVNELGQGGNVSVTAFTGTIEKNNGVSDVISQRSADGTEIIVSWEKLSLEDAGGFFENRVVLDDGSRKRQSPLEMRVPFTESSATFTGLDPATAYTITVTPVVINQNGVEAEGSTSEPIVQEPNPEHVPPTEPVPNNIPIIIGVVVAVVVIIVLLIVAVVVIVIYRKRKATGKLEFDRADNLFYPSSNQNTALRTFSNPIDMNDAEAEANGKARGTSFMPLENDPLDEEEDPKKKLMEEDMKFLEAEKSIDRSKPIAKTTFHEHVQTLHEDADKEYELEYKSVPMAGDESISCAISEPNKPKNRFANIFPYDHSRVKLSVLKDMPADSDYINASFVDGYRNKECYLCAQGPLPTTLGDFWRMIWEKRITNLVMLTGVVEGGKKKCEQYWPENVGESIEVQGGIQITMTSKVPFSDYVIHSLKVTKPDDADSAPLEVTHFHYTAWPDHGVPQFATSLIGFINRVQKSHDKSKPAPLLVHCSAGVGRTGTFVMLDTMIDRLRNEDSLNVYEFLKHMRGKRMYMVQTLAQYVFIHDALDEYITCGETDIPASNLKVRVSKMHKVIPSKNITGFTDQYQLLEQVCYVPNEAAYADAKKPFNTQKNRYEDIVPLNLNRPRLRPDGSDGSDYINASCVDGYKQRNAYIVTQGPLKHTVDDFWRMIVEFKSKTLVMLCNTIEEGQEKCHMYWPTKEGEPVEYGKHKVTLQSETVSGDYIIRKLLVQNEKSSAKHEREGMVVTQFHYTQWSEHGHPSGTGQIIEMIDMLTRNQMNTGNKAITVVCNDGVGRSGAFLCIHSQLERLKTEGEIDVFKYLKSARTKRIGLVSEIGDYVFIHEVLADYVESFDPYANFKN